MRDGVCQLSIIFLLSVLIFPLLRFNFLLFLFSFSTFAPIDISYMCVHAHASPSLATLITLLLLFKNPV